MDKNISKKEMMGLLKKFFSEHSDDWLRKRVKEERRKHCVNNFIVCNRVLNHVIMFDGSSAEFVLRSVDMSLDEDGFIVKDSKRVIGINGLTVHIDNFAGLSRKLGVITRDLPSLIKLSDDIKEMKVDRMYKVGKEGLKHITV